MKAKREITKKRKLQDQQKRAMTRRQGYEKLLDLIKEGHVLSDHTRDHEQSHDQTRGLMISTQIALFLAAASSKSNGKTCISLYDFQCS